MCGLLVMQMLLIAHYCVSPLKADSATGLGIEILDNNDVAIAINGESGFRDLVLNENGDANLTFKLRYKSTQENVHAGQANALLYFDIDYQ